MFNVEKNKLPDSCEKMVPFVCDSTMLFNIITNFHVFEINWQPMERKKWKKPFHVVTIDGIMFSNAWFHLKSLFW